MSAAIRVLRPLGHLASALILGPVWLTLLLVGWATGFALIVTLVGVVVLLGLAHVARGAGDLERRLAAGLLDVRVPRPPRPVWRGSILTSLRAWVTDPGAWREQLYLLLRFVLGVPLAAVLIGLIGGGIQLMVAVTYYRWAPPDIGVAEADTIGEALLCIPLGAAATFLGLWLVRPAAAAWRPIARTLLTMSDRGAGGAGAPAAGGDPRAAHAGVRHRRADRRADAHLAPHHPGRLLLARVGGDRPRRPPRDPRGVRLGAAPPAGPRAGDPRRHHAGPCGCTWSWCGSCPRPAATSGRRGWPSRWPGRSASTTWSSAVARRRTAGRWPSGSTCSPPPARARSTQQAAELRRIERDLHDGAQARLVALAMDLGMARERLADDPAAPRSWSPGRTSRRSRRSPSSATSPAASTRWSSPTAACPPRSPRSRATATSRSSSTSGPASGRPPPSRPPPTSWSPRPSRTPTSTAAPPARRCGCCARPTCCGSASPTTAPAGPTPAASGLRGLRRRVEALDGAMAVASPPGGRTVIDVELPCGS